MSLKRLTHVFAFAFAIPLLLASQANATFTITPLTVINPGGATPNMNFVYNSLVNAPLPTTGVLGQSYNFLSVNVFPGAANVTNQVVPYDIVYQATDNTTHGTATFEVKGLLTLNLDASGSGSLYNTPAPGFPTPSFTLGSTTYHINPVPPNYTSPTLLNGSGGTAQLQINLTTVPEPSSILVMGLSVGVGGLLWRRNLAKKA
ncbi:PEP-CTERM protein-sorting domain-containing protein [Singulisphaera sp. GP187]|uniref:PEP-CTERM sorting domain-containing protein n=1 Tax=Singulisphaera sp. GP187 TaxID=1882752 RepID=UPI000928653E|nr:PEP-CTERM sorting domain-containing protein [Singulisphaera sp. GP187]SIO43966.1 PEP-CTERM protein-sorting domain-containing protein [Singulisphaera sp. GP187]